MNLVRWILSLCLAVALTAVTVGAQTGSDKQFTKDGLTFNYPTGWTLQDDTDKDAQNLTLARADSDVSINVFVHKGRITPEKFAEAKKAFIDPYITARGKQFISMGAKPEQSPDSIEIAGLKSDGTVLSANLGGETGAAKIYWVLLGQRVVLLTYFGPDKQLKQFLSAWDLVRTSIKIEDPKAAPKASPTP